MLGAAPRIVAPRVEEQTALPRLISGVLQGPVEEPGRVLHLHLGEESLEDLHALHTCEGQIIGLQSVEQRYEVSYSAPTL